MKKSISLQCLHTNNIVKKSSSSELHNLQNKKSIYKIKRSQSLPNVHIYSELNQDNDQTNKTCVSESSSINLNFTNNIRISFIPNKRKILIYHKQQEILHIYKNRIKISNKLKTQLIYYYSSNKYKRNKLIQEVLFTLYQYIYYNIINRIIYNDTNYIFILLIHMELCIVLSSLVGYYTKIYIKKSDEGRVIDSRYEEKTDPPEWKIKIGNIHIGEIANIYLCNFFMVVCDSYKLDMLSDMIKLYMIYLYATCDIESNIIRKIGLIVSMICFIISDIDFNIDSINQLNILHINLRNFIDKNSYLSYFNIGLGISLSCFLTKFLPSLPKFFM